MAMIHSSSVPIVNSGADIFSLPSTDTTVENSFYAEFKPTVNILDSNFSKLEFRIVQSSAYLNLNDSFLYLKAKVCKGDDGDLTADNNISTANLFLHSMFSQCDVFVNNQPITEQNNCYGYKSYLQTLLSHGKEYFESQGPMQMFYKDTDGNICADSNLGFKKRKEIIAQSKTFEILGRLNLDICHQERLMVNDTNISVVLTRALNQFCLIEILRAATTGTNAVAAQTTCNPKVKILDASLFVRKENLYPSVVLAHQKIMSGNENAKYILNRSNINFFTIPQSNQTFIEENVFNSSIPSKMIVALVPNADFSGVYGTNPFKFDHHKISNINVAVNNVPTPIRTINLDFENNEYLLAYRMLLSALNVIGEDNGIILTPEDYKKGNTIFAYDLTRNGNSSLALEQQGSVRLEINFKSPLTSALTCLVYYEHPSILEINKFREIHFE